MFKDELDAYKENSKYDESLVLEILSDIIDEHGKECVDKAIKRVHEKIYGHHFNEVFADKAVSEFYYSDEDGTRIYGPFITKERAKEYYTKNNRQLTDTNFYDFYVALNKVMSDHKKLLKAWFPDEEDIMDKCVELTMSCINDDDYSTKGCKVWNHVNQDYLK